VSKSINITVTITITITITLTTTTTLLGVLERHHGHEQTLAGHPQVRVLCCDMLCSVLCCVDMSKSWLDIISVTL
jgi:hypothetical protein